MAGFIRRSMMEMEFECENTTQVSKSGSKGNHFIDAHYNNSNLFVYLFGYRRPWMLVIGKGEMNTSNTKIIRGLLIGFVGWFAIHGLYWGITSTMINKMSPQMETSAIGFLLCFLAPLPINVIALIVFLVTRQWWIAVGITIAFLTNSAASIFLSPANEYVIFQILSMVPFFMSNSLGF